MICNVTNSRWRGVLTSSGGPFQNPSAHIGCPAFESCGLECVAPSEIVRRGVVPRLAGVRERRRVDWRLSSIAVG